jgi:hypothetical protein
VQIKSSRGAAAEENSSGQAGSSNDEVDAGRSCRSCRMGKFRSAEVTIAFFRADGLLRRSLLRHSYSRLRTGLDLRGHQPRPTVNLMIP